MFSPVAIILVYSVGRRQNRSCSLKEEEQQNGFWLFGFFNKSLIVFLIKFQFKKKKWVFFRGEGLFWFSTLSSCKPHPPVWKSASAPCGSIIPALNLSMTSFKRGVGNPFRSTGTGAQLGSAVWLCPLVLINHDSFFRYQPGILLLSRVLKKIVMMLLFINE